MKDMLRPLAQFRWSPFRWAGINVPYDPAIGEVIKLNAPIRAWDYQTKAWWVPDTFIDHLKAVLSTSHKIVHLDSVFHRRNGRHSPDLPSWEPSTWNFRAENPYDTLCIQKDAPLCVVRAAHWALTHEMHEDMMMGGSSEPRLRVEEAFKQICLQRGVAP